MHQLEEGKVPVEVEAMASKEAHCQTSLGLRHQPGAKNLSCSHLSAADCSSHNDKLASSPAPCMLALGAMPAHPGSGSATHATLFC